VLIGFGDSGLDHDGWVFKLGTRNDVELQIECASRATAALRYGCKKNVNASSLTLNRCFFGDDNPSAAMPVCDFGDEESCLTTLAGSTEPRKVRCVISLDVLCSVGFVEATFGLKNSVLNIPNRSNTISWPSPQVIAYRVHTGAREGDEISGHGTRQFPPAMPAEFFT